MAHHSVDDEPQTNDGTCMLYDGDFIDLTSEFDLQNNSDNEVELVTESTVPPQKMATPKFSIITNDKPAPEINNTSSPVKQKEVPKQRIVFPSNLTLQNGRIQALDTVTKQSQNIIQLGNNNQPGQNCKKYIILAKNSEANKIVGTYTSTVSSSLGKSASQSLNKDNKQRQIQPKPSVFENLSEAAQIKPKNNENNNVMFLLNKAGFTKVSESCQEKKQLNANNSSTVEGLPTRFKNIVMQTPHLKEKPDITSTNKFFSENVTKDVLVPTFSEVDDTPRTVKSIQQTVTTVTNTKSRSTEYFSTNPEAVMNGKSIELINMSKSDQNHTDDVIFVQPKNFVRIVPSASPLESKIQVSPATLMLQSKTTPGRAVILQQQIVQRANTKNVASDKNDFFLVLNNANDKNDKRTYKVKILDRKNLPQNDAPSTLTSPNKSKDNVILSTNQMHLVKVNKNNEQNIVFKTPEKLPYPSNVNNTTVTQQKISETIKIPVISNVSSTMVVDDRKLPQNDQVSLVTHPTISTNQNSEDNPLYFFLYSMQNNQNNMSTFAEKTVVNEPPMFVDLANQEDISEIIPGRPKITEPPCVVPVDIKKILKQGRSNAKVEPKGRCIVNTTKNKSIYLKGFTMMEMRRPSCFKHLCEIIQDEEKRISELKRHLSLYETDFIHLETNGCDNNFLPEIVKYELDDSNDFTIEYNNIEDQINKETEDSEAIPSLSHVLKKINKEVNNLKAQRPTQSSKKLADDIQTALAKPEAALKLIKKGLELIKSWSLETQSSNKGKNKAKVPRNSPTKRKETNAKKKKVEIVQKPEPKKTNKRRSSPKKNEAKFPDKSEVTRRSSERRKRKTERYQDHETDFPKRKKTNANTDDNDLFLIRRVDILNKNKRGSKIIKLK